MEVPLVKQCAPIYTYFPNYLLQPTWPSPIPNAKCVVHIFYLDYLNILTVLSVSGLLSP